MKKETLTQRVKRLEAEVAEGKAKTKIVEARLVCHRRDPQHRWHARREVTRLFNGCFIAIRRCRECDFYSREEFDLNTKKGREKFARFINGLDAYDGWDTP